MSVNANPIINACLLSLGSNTEQQKLLQAVDKLATLGEICLSAIITGKDFTGKSKRLYHNACVFLTLSQTQNLSDLMADFKQMEQNCGRQYALDDDAVALDIDVLAYQTDNQWQYNPKKLPLKTHERLGVQEIAEFLLPNNE